MVTQITLGNFYKTSEGKTVMGSAGGSGLDTEALIKGLTDARGIAATQYQDQITLNDKKTTAFTTFQGLLDTFRTASDALRNPPGVGNDIDNVFKYTTGTVSANGADYVSITTEPGAVVQSFTLNNVTQLASAATQKTGTLTVASADTAVTVASPAAGKFTAGTVTINGQSITLVAGDTLNNIAAKFNAVSGNTGIGATVVKVGDNQFVLSFTATETGEDGGFDLTSTGVDPGNTVFGNVSLGAAVDGTNAKFKLNGISVERSSNSISDVVSGVTFDLLQTTSADENSNSNILINVKPDTVTVQNTIVNFATAYNALRKFATEQTQVKTDGTFADTAVLATNQTFRSIMNNISNQVTQQISGLSGMTSISDLGITLASLPASGDTPQIDNILNINDGKLASALATDFSAVSKVFGFTLSSNNANLKVYSATNELKVTNFSLILNPAGDSFKASYTLDGQAQLVDVTATPISGTNGYTLTGQEGTALEGLVLIYGSNATATINVTATQGVAHKLYNNMDASLKDLTGSLAIELETLKDTNTRLGENVTQINLQVSLYREQLLVKFGALEQALSKINTLLQSLDAQQQAANNSN